MITPRIESTLLLLFLLLCFSVYSQPYNEILQKKWNAFWVAVPGEPATDYGVYRFRKTVDLKGKQDRFVVHVSGDNRYKLYVNGTQVSHGPARSDIFHWNFETVDLAPFLETGENVIAAVVWNEGAYRPEAQISLRTAFILQGDTEKEEVLNTNKSWKATRDNSYQPIVPQLIHTYYVSGPGELVDMNQHDTQWMKSNLNESSWGNAQELFNGLPKGVFDWSEGWMLKPRPIPQMEEKYQRFEQVRRSNGLTIPDEFPQKKTNITIAANTTATLLLDQGYLTNAYPTLLFSNGKDALLSLSFAEALYIDEGKDKDWRAQNQKGNRNELEGKRFVGREDRVISNGSQAQSFTTLNWRTFRYVQLTVQTKNEPLVLVDVYSHFTGYPFEKKAKFTSGNDTLLQILEVGWRTARLCAVETYMDCPYYEQLQYFGDTRIQALVSLFNAGDDRLVRNAINQADWSRMAEGITLSRYPTAHAQQIPPFSLWWIGMLHDYWRYRPDTAFVKEKLPGTRQVLQFFSRYQQADGSLKNAPYWNFTDWTEGNGWQRGIAPAGKDGTSAALDLQLLWAFQLAGELESRLGMPAYASQYQSAANQLKRSIRNKYWNASEGLFADTKEKTLYSQHVNALAILTGLTSAYEAKNIGWKILSEKTLSQATIYFRYYIHQALVKAGYGNDYLNWLDVWKENLQMGLTTLAEKSDINQSRSDCHAWGAHPNIEFYRTVLGIDSDAAGFSRVKIEPHLGALKNVSGEMPHPNGTISVAYKNNRGRWVAEITLPKNTRGHLMWKGKRYELGEKNRLTL